jgi:hypothetical protein
VHMLSFSLRSLGTSGGLLALFRGLATISSSASCLVER